MSAFKTLEDVSKQFGEDLRKCSIDLVAIKVGDAFDDNVSRKLKDLALFTSKLHLLRAKPLSSTPEISQVERNEQTTISNYGDTVTQKIIEQQIVKNITQSHSVRKLLISKDDELQQNYREQKEKILSQLDIYKQKETHLRLMDAQLREKQEEYNTVREQWDHLLGQLKVLRSKVDTNNEQDSIDPLKRKLKSLVQRMEMFRFLIKRIVPCRTTNYDWLADPDQLLPILKQARHQNTIAMFTED